MLLRTGRPQQQQPKGKRLIRPKKAAAPKKDWVSTVNDLSVHKLSPAELCHRHEIHKSHNKAAAHWELREKALKRRLRHAGSSPGLDHTSLTIIRDVFSEQPLLHDALAQSDRALAVVKDLFGDAPRRQTGHPSVTVAPNCDSDSELPVLQRPDPPTQLSLLSQSIMDQEALNEVEVLREDVRDEDLSSSSGSRFIRRTNIRKTKTQTRATQKQKGHRLRSHAGDKENIPVTPIRSGRAPDPTALNATAAVKRFLTKQRPSDQNEEEASVLVSQVLNPELPSRQSGRIRKHTEKTRKGVCRTLELDGSSVASLSGDQSSLGLLQDMLGQVKANLDTMSSDIAPEPTGSPEPYERQGLTGFSVALVSTIGRLVQLIRKREAEAQEEAEERRRLQEDLKEQRGLMDALTAETMTLREEGAAMQAGLLQRTTELEQKLDSVVLLMSGLGVLGEQTKPSRVSDGRVSQSCVCQSVGGDEKTQTRVSPAVLLSPPQQCDNWQQSPVHALPLQRRLSPSDTQRSCESVQSHVSTSALMRCQSVSSSSLPSNQPVLLPSPKAMLAEIAELKRQNDLIKAQLIQAKSLGSGNTGLADSCNEQSKSSPASGTGERKMTGQHLQSPEGTSSASQAASSSTPSVEQRLLELNRQSAAARSRLLELIEQQKRSSSLRISPSVSPIPSSAVSPNAAAEGQSSEESVLPPEREFGSHRQYAGSDASNSLSFESKTGEIKQNEKRREREGWFSLVAHTR
ncbi:spindle and centriole-associated protein 1 isoform X1 [Xiphophorus couchianus]|uniref:spindle and centriole-associated protein 1 isoform X1 n=1 Tax=Xiphophorus couchianus TaxID=32473 RepID=UPI00101672C2|nr:spindle and centriole-associated protein 1 isoform X1 [Xiphophorus couchianus]